MDKILKESFVDIIATVAIIGSIFYQNDTYIIILWVYTGLILLGKIMALFMPSLAHRASKSTQDAPAWVFHVFYALSCACFLYIGKWYLAGAWILVWSISIYTFYFSKKN